MVSLVIDGQNIQVAKDTTILEAAAQLGIKIPTLCWLQKVSPTGACRICAVEIEGVERTMTACNTPVKEGIKVTTQSDRISEIRRKILELLLVNHPLDCPVCDAAGECDLQDSCVGLGATRQEYSALLEKRPIRYDWPLIESDPNRCILCEKCVKVDHEVVGCDAIAVVNRGEATIIDTVDGKPLNCEFCGNCIAACPTGTLISKPFKFRGRPWAFTVSKSVCAFCAAGCQIEYHARNGRVERVTSDDNTFNSGNLCINGRFGYNYLNSGKRLTQPLLNGKNASWNDVMAAVVRGIQEITSKQGADAVAGIGSPRVSNEESYLFQKLMRAAIGTNNIDSMARLGYAQTQAVLRETLGVTGATATIDKIDTASAILVLGCDLNAESTAMEYRVIKACTKNDAKLVLANMRDVKLSKFNHGRLKYRPGTEVMLVNALAKLILDAGLENKDFIAKSGANIEELKGALASLSIADAAATTGVPEAELNDAARFIATKPGLAIIFGADIIRGTNPDAAVRAIVNLAILTGAVGGGKGGLFPVDERTNVQGMLDMGVAPDYLPGYQTLGAGASALESAWGVRIPATAGKGLWQIVEGIEQGAIKALYVVGTDLVGGFPDRNRIRTALQKLELLVVQDIFANETTALAHVVLPAAAAAEKSGSFTSLDNRVQCFTKAVSAPGEAREDWDIMVELYNRLAYVNHIYSVQSLLDEIKKVTGIYCGACSPVEGRCVGTIKQAAVKDKLSFAPVAAPAPLSGTMALTGSILFHNGTMSTLSANNLSVAPEAYIELFAADAAAMGVTEGVVIKVSTDAGSVTAKARVSERLQPGLVFIPNHFAALGANGLFKGAATIGAARVEKA